jgi:hypothetical protein
MRVIDFIKLKISELLDYPSIKCVRYGVSKWTGAHMIEITPAEALESDEFIDIEISISDKFQELFPKDELIFISNEDIIGLTDSEVVICEKRKASLKYEIDDNKRKPLITFTIEGLDDNPYDDSDDFQLAA